MCELAVIRHCLAVLCCLALAVPLSSAGTAADNPTVIIDDGFDRNSMKAAMAMYEDSSMLQSFEQVRSEEFIAGDPAIVGTERLGYRATAYWYRFVVRNVTDRPVFLLLDSRSGHVAEVELITYDARLASPVDADIQRQLTGLNFPVTDRPLHTSYFIFPVTIPEKAEVQFYYRLVSPFASAPIPVLMNYKVGVESIHGPKAFSYFFYGICLILILYNMVLVFKLGEINYLYYTIFVVCFMLFHGAGVGTLYYYWPDPWFPLLKNSLFWASGFWTTAAFMQLSRVYLQLKTSAPWADTLLKIIALIALCASVLVFQRHLQLAVPMLNFLSSFAYLFGFGMGIYLWRRGQIMAMNFAMGCAVLFASLALLLVLDGLAPAQYPNIVEWSLEAGFMIQILILSLGLGDRLNRLKEESLSQREVAISAQAEARVKSQFLATMSHEIRTPINGVLGMSELLQDTSLDDDQHRYVETIQTSGKALLGVINDILDFSKIEAGQMEMEHVPLSLEDIVDDCVSIFSITAANKKIEMNAYVVPGTPLVVKSDPNRLRQILLNFLSNAFKFTNSGEVKLSVMLQTTRRVENRNEAHIKFEVADSGVGISQDSQNNLFKAFSQADISTSRKYGGTGLGLVISKRLVELLGGEVGFSSDVGVGSTFWFTIPLDLPLESELQPKIDIVRGLSGKRVLIIDDNDTFCEVTRALAMSWGMSVAVAQNRDSAMLLLQAACNKSKPYDVVILDLQLPDVNGLQLAEMIRDDVMIASVPIVMVTSTRHTPSQDELRAAGILVFSEKPVPAKRLRRMLIQALGLGELDIVHHKELAAHDYSYLNVVIAEDNKINQMVVKGMLAKMDIVPELLEDGIQAVEYMRKIIANDEVVDIFFMDCEMPGLDGYEATRKIRELEQATNRQAMQIVALSAHAIDEYQAKALSMGMNHYLTKPITFETLSTFIHKFVGDRSSADGSRGRVEVGTDASSTRS